MTQTLTGSRFIRCVLCSYVIEYLDGFWTDCLGSIHCPDDEVIYSHRPGE